ncbi:MAG: TVP38/TMEM64 family protein [Pseudonocardiaceae bacterium]|nr:TVP38/TMEM64 family protein [Pseudonocardiaceae bacterium]
MRSWAVTAGPAGILLFVLANGLITVAPIPRTVFTLAAGLLFGPVGGVGVALAATTISAMLAFGLIRALGRDLVAPLLDRGTLRSIDGRLRRRGWLAVASLRLIPVVPFSILNYCSALSAIRWRQFLAGTVGVVPGTIAVVLLGDALTGSTSPTLIAVSVLCAAVGVVGLFVDARTRLPALPH